MALNFDTKVISAVRSYYWQENTLDNQCANMNHLQQNMLEKLLYSPYNQLQIILKIKAQM